MIEAHRHSPTIPCYIVTDAIGLKKYGLGMVRPGALNLRPFLNDGYLTAGASLAELGAKLAINSGQLEATVARMLEWESLAEREQKWTAFLKDEEWQKVWAETDKDGALVRFASNQILQPVQAA